ncbi:lytic transglycosylase domain-containing protein [Bradyrhizobium sp. WSM 1704]|nr:lytic transglycosylase domain-containing protein [Bradyrhizobium semiaridum]
MLAMLAPAIGAGAEDTPGAATGPPSAEQPVPPPAEKPAMPPAAPSAEKPADPPAAAPADKPATPEEKSASSPPEKPQAADKPADGRESDTREAMCLMIESAARANDLPLEFFARVIWQESRFQADAVGPVTRNGQRAQGIAQFMPGTASERGLLDPFNPVQALPKSAEFLSELRGQFGNLGLAAAAYNAGPRRIQEWLAGTGYMPQETRAYVYAITGSSVDDWAAAGRTGKMPERKPTSSCRELMALLKRAPNPFVAGLEQHVTLSAAKAWGVQLAAGFSRDKALAMYARAMKRLSNVIGDQDPSLLSSRLRTRGSATFYQVRIGADTRPEADGLCNRIRKAGGACFVLKNRA